MPYSFIPANTESHVSPWFGDVKMILPNELAQQNKLNNVDYSK